jgi:hypothetical protein
MNTIDVEIMDINVKTNNSKLKIKDTNQITKDN